MYLWVDVSYDRIYFSSSISGTIGTKIKKDIKYKNAIWPKDSLNFQVIGDVNIGYSIFDNKKIRINPYIGLMFNNHVQGCENQDTNQENTSFTNNQFITFGIIIDKAISYRDCYTTIIEKKSKNVEYLRFKIGYLHRKYPILAII